MIDRVLALKALRANCADSDGQNKKFRFLVSHGSPPLKSSYLLPEPWTVSSRHATPSRSALAFSGVDVVPLSTVRSATLHSHTSKAVVRSTGTIRLFFPLPRSSTALRNGSLITNLKSPLRGLKKSLRS